MQSHSKNQKSISILLMFLLVFINFVHAQKDSVHHRVWNLQQCIDYALKTNLQLKQTGLNSEVNKVNLQQSEANLLPNLNAGAQNIWNGGRAVNQYTNTFANSTVLSQNIYLGTSLTLFSGMQKYNTISQNQLNYSSGKYDMEKNANDITLDVVSAYLQILLNQELLEVSQNQLEITQKQLDHTQKLYEAGTISKGNLLDMQAQMASDELALTNSQNQSDLSYLSLGQLMNLDSINGFRIQTPELALPIDNLTINNPEQIYAQAIRQLPEVKSAELKLMSAEKGVSVAKGQISPQLSFNLNYGTGYSGLPESVEYTNGGYAPIGFVSGTNTAVLAPSYIPTYITDGFLKQYQENFNSSIGFSLKIPLFNGLQTNSAISKAKISRISAEITVEQTKQVLKKSIQQAYADADAALKKYLATNKAVDASAESFKYSDQKYNVGALNAFDYNLAKTKLAKAKSDMLQAKYEFIFRSRVLGFYQGKPLTL
jgi:outer membrane protein